jgi:hypothetical protein
VRQLDPFIAVQFKIVWPQNKAPDGSTLARTLVKRSKGIQVLKTEQSANEKVTLINETSNQLFV